MYSEISSNKRKTWIIMFFFMAIISLLAWFLSAYWFGEPSVTFVVVGIALIYALISFFSGGKMALAINGAKEVTDSTDRLYRTVENLAITTGLPMPKVYVIEDPALNAFATGRDPKHASVAATRGLIDRLDDSELEGVMAHELGHVQNYDIRVSMIAFALVAIIAVISDIMLRSFIFGGGNRGRGGGGGGGAIAIVGLAVAILAPLAAQLLKMAISRKREYLADATGALTTRYPEGLASALEKIKTNGASLQKQSTATAHLFFANPLKDKRVSGLFATHPPIDERIARLRGMGDKL